MASRKWNINTFANVVNQQTGEMSVQGVIKRDITKLNRARKKYFSQFMPIKNATHRSVNNGLMFGGY